MTSVQPDQQPSDPGANRRALGSPLLRPLAGEPAGAGGSGLARPRLKMIATTGDLTPAGATYTPPTTTPLPERGAGLHLSISVLAAILALVFLVLLAQNV